MSGPLDGKRWPFERDITIGRDESAVQAALPTDGAASRRHAAVTARESGFELADIGSSNGTFVAGQAIESPVAIAAGEPFVVGRTLLRVVVAADAH